MNNSKILTKAGLSLCTLTILFLAVSVTTWAQTDSPPKKRLPSSASVKGFVGGESHDGYVIRARKGQALKVRISWAGKGDKKAQFVVSKSADFFSGDVVEGGRETYDGKNWIIKAPTTGDYYIYVTAHPAARYTLRVTVK